MPTDWRRLYEAALHENDPAKITEVCECARRAINEHELTLTHEDAGYLSTKEKLDEALRQLLIHEHAVKLGRP